MKERLSIKVYAHDTIQQIVTTFRETHQIEATIELSKYIKYALYGTGIIVTLFIGAAFIRWLFVVDDIAKLSTLTKEVAEKSAQGNANLQSTHQIIEEVIKYLKTHSEVSGVILKRVNDAVKIAFTKTDTDIANLQQGTDDLRKLVKQVLDLLVEYMSLK